MAKNEFVKMPPTYNKNVWGEEIAGIRWYVEWEEKGCEACGTDGTKRKNYFKTKQEAWDFTLKLQKAKNYVWYKEPGWEEVK